MNVKIINLFLLLNLSSCGSCKEHEKQKVPRRPYNPNHDNCITFFHISDAEARDIKFWETYNIDEKINIFPIQHEIKSDTWEENGNILIAITAFLTVAKNVEMFNSYKNLTPLNKLLFFIAHTINQNRNISKYEYLFCQEFKKTLKAIYPDEYEILLKNPIALEMKLQLLIVNGIKEKNPESQGKVNAYVSCEKDNIKTPVRKFMFIPDQKDIVDSKYNWFWMLIDIDDKIPKVKFQKLLIDERNKYLQTKQKPDLLSLKDEVVKIIAHEFQENIKTINSVNIKYSDLINSFASQISDVKILENIICCGRFYGWFNVSLMDMSKKLKNDFNEIQNDKKKRFLILTNYAQKYKDYKADSGCFGYQKIFSMGHYIELYIDLDKQKFSISPGNSTLYQE